jgi:hypothetical protein
MPSPTASTGSGPFAGVPTLSDPLTDASIGGWDVSSNPGQGSCAFAQDGYHVLSEPNYGSACYSRRQAWSTFAFQVEMKVIRGTSTSWGGILFRAGSHGTGYQFGVRADGKYYLALCTYHNSGTDCGQVLLGGYAAGFHAGLGQANRLGLVARGASLSIYLNEHALGTATDTTYSQGLLALLATPSNENALGEIVYSNANWWML